AGSITNDVVFNVNGGPTSSNLDIVVNVAPGTPDLTASMMLKGSNCTNTPKAAICTIVGLISLLNNGDPYFEASYTLTRSCKLPPKVGCKITPVFVLNTQNLASLPSHEIAFYLSDDDTLDDTDTLMGKVTTAALEAAIVHAKPPKLKLKVPGGIDVSGKF